MQPFKVCFSLMQQICGVVGIKAIIVHRLQCSDPLQRWSEFYLFAKHCLSFMKQRIAFFPNHLLFILDVHTGFELASCDFSVTITFKTERGLKYKPGTF